MLNLLWLSPILIILILVISNKVNITFSAMAGFFLAILISILFSPKTFDIIALQYSISRGLWIGTIISPYIIGGLLFWQIAFPTEENEKEYNIIKNNIENNLKIRRLLFTACFLIGPFAESATGFGIGILGTIALLKNLNIEKKYLIILGLLSQTFIPWGNMGSSTIVAATYAKLKPHEIGLTTLPIISLFIFFIWLPLYWVVIKHLNLKTPISEYIYEIFWMIVMLIFLAIATYSIGIEISLLSAFGTIIVIRYLLYNKPSFYEIFYKIKSLSFYMSSIIILIILCLSKKIQYFLINIYKVQPFYDLPSFHPFFHIGILFFIFSLIILLVQKRLKEFQKEVFKSLKLGKHAILTVFIFSMMTEILLNSGITNELSKNLVTSIKEGSIYIIPLLSEVIGVLTNSGNASNSLFMNLQINLANDFELKLLYIAAIQLVASTCLGIISPVRLAIATQIVGENKYIKYIYLFFLPATIGMTLILLLSIWLITH